MRNIILEAKQINSKGMFKDFNRKINDLKINKILRNKNEKKNMIDSQAKLDKQICNFKNKNR